jgi:hypothetical protein
LFVWFGVVLLVRFPSAIAPESGNTDRHRGANRLPAKRKTDAQTKVIAHHSKIKQREISGSFSRPKGGKNNRFTESF